MKTVKQAKIRIHSFVDLITNSSTEIYVAASQNTVKSVKEIINNVLILAGSSLTADDLFDIKLGEVEERGEYGGETRDLIVMPKNTTDANAQIAARLLSNLTGIFNIDASHNG